MAKVSKQTCRQVHRTWINCCENENASMKIDQKLDVSWLTYYMNPRPASNYCDRPTKQLLLDPVSLLSMDSYCSSMRQ